MSTPDPEKKTTAHHWTKHTAGSEAFSPNLYWLAIPLVQSHYQQRACADLRYASWVEYCVHEFLGARTPARRMLSIGCGSGALERHLFRLNAFIECDGIDLAPAAIEKAKHEAKAIGADSIRYVAMDVELDSLPHERYDAVWFDGSLHHIRDLESVCARVHDALNPGGWLFFNEYVGSNYFAFGEWQQACIRHSYGLIPERYRKSFVSDCIGQPQDRAAIPDPEEVRRIDPSEAVRSQDILDVVERLFETRARNWCGGSLLQFLLHGIAGNFDEADADSIRILQMLLDIEDALIDSGSLESDFVVFAGQPK